MVGIARSSRPLRRASAVVLSGVLALGLGGAQFAEAAPPPKVTNHGVAGVDLGDRAGQLRKHGRIGALKPGCPLGGTDVRYARLKGGVDGVANFTSTTPRRVTDVQIRGGAKFKGVGIGATRKQIRKKFPHARFDNSTKEVFGIVVATIPKRDGGRVQMAIEVGTNKVGLIGVPHLAFCE